ncbi:MAG: PrsW family glutamic-type intramembrane protease [Tissierellaceae bacterium]|nr:PrsW family glutamic-type intramembrane protease [Tissierellaceae bacterium]
MNLRLFIIAITPVIVLLLAIYLTDKSDREPTKLLLLTFLFGALAVIPTIIVEEFLIRFNVFSGTLQAAYNAFIVAAFTEEYFKRLVILKLPFRTSYFNEKLDGIVYGVFAHLGFAVVENIMYVVFTYTNNPFIGLYRGIFSVPAHGVFGVTMGYYLSLSRFDNDKKRKAANMRKSLIMPILFHGVFDFILMAEIPELTLLFVPYVLFIWWVNGRKLSKFVYDSRSRIIRKKE